MIPKHKQQSIQDIVLEQQSVQNQIDEQFSYIRVCTRDNYLAVAQILGLKAFQMKDGALYLNQNQISQQKLSLLLTHLIKQSFLNTVCFNSVGSSRIIHQLTPISWKTLKNLYLAQNNITSIQALTFIRDLNTIEVISLTDNQITKVRCLAKLNCPQLQTLLLDGNKISQMDYELFWMDQLSEFSLDFNKLSFQFRNYVKFRPNARATEIFLNMGTFFVPYVPRRDQYFDYLQKTKVKYEKKSIKVYSRESFKH